VLGRGAIQILVLDSDRVIADAQVDRTLEHP
jgi:hypothetical protein